MKKILNAVLILLTVAVSVHADDLRNARQRERDAINGIGYPHGPLIPGLPGTGPRIHPRPPLPPPPPPPPMPDRSNLYGPGRTVRWQDMGSHRTQKFVATDIKLAAMGQFVNELYLVAQDNHVQINEVKARLVNGQVVDLNHLRGTVRKGQQMRLKLDAYYSLRVDEIILNVESPNLFGSRGSLAVQLGLAW